jgi:hypothetical protein
MTELILSDITVMGPGYCVLGLERVSAQTFRSIRPMPPWGFAWREPFPFRRGDCADVRLQPTGVAAPHFEDRGSDGLRGTGRIISEELLVQYLKQAEASRNLEGLFGCPVQAGSHGGRALWVDPSVARRSICGCEYENLRLRLFPESEGYTLRAEMLACSSQRIQSIPIVDRDWRRFVDGLVKRVRRDAPLPLVERFMNRTILPKIF